MKANQLLAAMAVVAACAAFAEDSRRVAFQTALPAGERMSVDGKLDEPAWQAANWNDRYYEFLKPNPKRVKLHTESAVLFGADGLYVGVRNFETKLDKIRRSVTRNHHGVTWCDDCGEFYVDPGAQGIGFYKFTVNSRGCFDDEWQMDRANRFSEWNSEGVKTAAQIDEANGLWTIEMMIPWSDLGRTSAPKPGDIWMFNHNRFRYAERGWSDFCSSSPEAAYQAPDKFGYLLFSDGSLPDIREIARRVGERLDIAWFIEVGGQLAFHDEDGIHFSTPEEFEAKRAERAFELAKWKSLVPVIAKVDVPMPKVDIPKKETQQPPSKYDGYNGYYIHHYQGTFVTPHFDWGGEIADTPYVVWANPYWGARMRHGAELFERFGFNGECMTTFWNSGLGGHGSYDDPVKGGTPNEKEAQFGNILLKNPDVMMFWNNFPVGVIRSDLYYEVLRRIHDEGMGFVLGNGAHFPSKDLGQMKRDTALENRILQGAPYAPEALRIFVFGKGRIATLDNARFRDKGWDLGWAADFECRNAFLARIVMGVSGRLRDGLRPGDVRETRVRNARNEVVDENGPLPAGTYYRDFVVREAPPLWTLGLGRGKVVDFGYTPFVIEGEKLAIDAPHAVPEAGPFAARVTLEKPSCRARHVKIMLRDLPDGHLRAVQTGRFNPGATNVVFKFKGYPLTNLAGYLEAEVTDETGRVTSTAWRHVYFPNWDWPVYTQINWESLNNDGVAGLVGRRMVDEWGWDCNLGEMGPYSAHWNARGLAHGSLLRMGAYPNGAFRDALSCAVTGWNGTRWSEIKKVIGDDEHPWRPIVREMCDREYARRVSESKAYGHTAYNLGDECGFSTAAGYGPSDREFFPKFLEMKYGTIENYNRIAHTNFTSFAQVPHLKLKEARDTDNTQAWFDQIQYAERIYAEAMRMHRDSILKIEPKARVGAEGSVPGDLEETVRGLKFWGPYKSKIQNEVLREIAEPDVLRGIWWGGYVNEPRDGLIRLQWEFMLTGASNCNLWYTAEPGSTMGIGNGAYEIAPYYEKELPHLQALRWGAGHQLVVTPLYRQGLALWYSHESNRAAELDETAVQPGDTQNAFIDYCYRKGLGLEIITKNRLDALRRQKVVVLAGCHALGEDEIAALREFAKAGGRIVSDCEPCRFTKWMTRRGDTPLKDAIAERFSPLGTLRRKLKDDVAFDAKVTALVAPGGVAPVLKLTGAEKAPRTILRLRQGADFLLAGVLFPQEADGGSFSLKFNDGKPRHVYRIDGGYVGYADHVDFEAYDYPWAQFSFFDQEQSTPPIPLEKREFKPGECLTLAAKAFRPNGVYRMTVSGPRTEKKVWCVKDGSKPYTFDFALDDEPGEWTLRVDDLATGLSSAETLVLGESK